MTLGVSLVSALFISAANGCGCGTEGAPQEAAPAQIEPSLPPTEPVAGSAQLSRVLFCPKLRFQYQPGTFVWQTKGHPPSQSDPSLYDCDQGNWVLFYGDYEYGECVNGEGTGGCFEHQDSLADQADRTAAKKLPSFRLPTERPSDAAYSSFELPREGNDHVTDWPADKNVRGEIVRVETPDGKPFCHLKLFDLRLRLGAFASAGEPVETMRIGVEVAAPEQEPDTTVRLSALQTATDGRTGGTFDGLYQLKLVNQDYFVRMMRRLPDET
jgi:hypothetical protein